MYDICCVGHITSDRIVTPTSVNYMAGGTAFYFSNAVCDLDVSYALVTALARKEMHYVADLRARGISVQAGPSKHTIYFENIYQEDHDFRTQKVVQKADPFTDEQLRPVHAAFYHLGPLLADDFSVDFLKTLSLRGKISLDVQGFLREVRHENVYSIEWARKKEALPFVHILKANEFEMERLTGLSDVRESAQILFDWGVKEVVITLGSKGSLIYNGDTFYDIPAFYPRSIVDATGCGDTYMAGYLYQRIKGAGFQEAGEFGAAMASIKIGLSGPFTGNKESVRAFLTGAKTKAAD